jgi:hypothetical protein
MRDHCRPRYLRALLPIAIVLVAACGSQGSAPGAAVSARSEPLPSSSAEMTSQAAISTAISPGPLVEAAAAQSSCTDSGAASSPGPTRIVSKAANDDTFTITFDQGVPEFQVFTQPNARFTADPSGMRVLLPGSAGVRIVLRGLTFPSDPSGPSSFSPGGQLVLEIRRIGDFEGVVSWGVGLRNPGCAHVTASGSTLTFRFLQVSGKG